MEQEGVMTATDELRRMLDERGVEYQYVDKRGCVPSCEVVAWLTEDDDLWQYSAEYSVYHDGSTLLEFECSKARCTPAQAIAATLGRGTCHDKNGFDPEMGFECVECGATTDSYMCSTYPGIQEQLRYCPGCGAKVVNA